MNTASHVAEQYKTSANLDARIALHERFTVSNEYWPHWVFDQFDLPATSQLLEVGCGTGMLWKENLPRIPAGWEITLSDQSAGMLQQARTNVAGSTHTFRFEQFDTQSIPCAGESLDAVIANHMLYHVPDLLKALGEIRRVLKPSGKLFAATNGERHLLDFHQLLQRFDPDDSVKPWRLGFSLENGGSLLTPFFPKIELRRFESSLRVTEVEPLLAYARSMSMIRLKDYDQFQRFLEQELNARGGVIEIQKDAGLFLASK